MKLTLADLDLYWVGTDTTTPTGCVIATGYDPLGNRRLFLWRGDEPSDDAFLGSVLTPERGTATAYGPTGAYVASGRSEELLARLATT